MLSRSGEEDVCQLDTTVGVPSSRCVESTLTDFYQLTMCYAYWKAGKHEDHSVFDLFFRRCPFHGEYVVLAGVEEVLRFINTFHFSLSQISYLRSQLENIKDESFFEYLRSLDCSKVTLYSAREGTLVFAKEPVMRVEGPLAICQLLETPLLNLLNFPSLLATNASRYRLLAGNKMQLLEFGTRRAQGPDGAMSASRYTFLGGFDGTSNVRAGHVFGIPIVGTHAHAFVTAFEGLHDLDAMDRKLGDCEDFRELAVEKRGVLRAKVRSSKAGMMNEGEFAAFIAYALSFPSSCLCLIDTYNTIYSGLSNFLSVAMALHSLGFEAKGVRLDSGDLAYLSKECRKFMLECSIEVMQNAMQNSE